MLDCQRAKMGIGHKIPVHSRQCKQIAKDVRVAFGRLRDPDRLTGKPVSHLLPGTLDREWARHDPRVG